MPFLAASETRRVSQHSRPACSKRWIILSVGAAVFVSACGTSDGALEPRNAELPAPTATSPSPAVPSTTTPIRLAPLDCVGGAVEVAERLLIERRRGLPALGCDGDAGDAGAEVCWSQCGDDQVFVDFDLDTTHPGHRRTVDGGAETIAVSYAARYASDVGGTTTAAETLVLTRSDPTRSWVLTDVEATNTSREQADAASTIDAYFAALRGGDYPTAAALMLPAESVDGRDDLGRLVDEGFLAGTTLDEIADALAQWCDSGAECTATPELEIEVTAIHSLRAIATYQLASGTFETTFLVDDSMIVGLPIKVG